MLHMLWQVGFALLLCQFVAAQNTTEVPQCAQSCITTALSTAKSQGCAETDKACICGKANFVGVVMPCAGRGCGAQNGDGNDQMAQTFTYVLSYCQGYTNVTVPSGYTGSNSTNTQTVFVTATSTGAASATASSASPIQDSVAQSSGLSAGAKAGIGAGVAVGVVVVAGIIAFFLFQRRRKAKRRQPETSTISKSNSITKPPSAELAHEEARYELDQAGHRVELGEGGSPPRYSPWVTEKGMGIRPHELEDSTSSDIRSNEKHELETVSSPTMTMTSTTSRIEKPDEKHELPG